MCYWISTSGYLKNNYSQYTPERYFQVKDLFTFLCFSTHIYCSTWTRMFPGLGLRSKFRHSRACQCLQVWIKYLFVAIHLLGSVNNLRLKIIIMNRSVREKKKKQAERKGRRTKWRLKLQAYLAYKTFPEGRESLAGRRLLLPECAGRVEKWGSWAEACDPGPAEQIGSGDQREA